MPLSWDISKIQMYKDNVDLAWQEYTEPSGITFTDVQPYLKTLIFSSVMVSLNTMTYKNVGEWYARLHLCEEIHCLNLFERWEGNDLVREPIKAKELVKYIGLCTNANENSRSQFVMNLIKNNKNLQYNEKQLTSKLRKLEAEFEEKVFQ